MILIDEDDDIAGGTVAPWASGRDGVDSEREMAIIKIDQDGHDDQ